jgi:hypothetical protein
MESAFWGGNSTPRVQHGQLVIIISAFQTDTFSIKGSQVSCIITNIRGGVSHPGVMLLRGD